MKFLKDITGRDGKFSSKKVWYNVAGFASTACLLWIAYKDTFEDYAFICLYAVYLVTVGGFEVMLKMMAMIIEFKNGKPSSITTETVTTKSEVSQ